MNQRLQNIIILLPTHTEEGTAILKGHDSLAFCCRPSNCYMFFFLFYSKEIKILQLCANKNIRIQILIYRFINSTLVYYTDCISDTEKKWSRFN